MQLIWLQAGKPRQIRTIPQGQVPYRLSEAVGSEDSNQVALSPAVLCSGVV